MLPLNLHTSIVTSCVPPFHCGSLPITCGTSSFHYGGMRSSTQPAEENGIPTDCKQPSSLKHVFSENTTSMLSTSFHLQHISENFPKQGKLFTKTSPPVAIKCSSDSDVVITQPTQRESLSAAGHPRTANGNCTNTKESDRHICLPSQDHKVPFSSYFQEDNDNHINHRLSQNCNTSMTSRYHHVSFKSESNRTASADLPETNMSKLSIDQKDHRVNQSYNSDTKPKHRGNVDRDFKTKSQISCSTSRNRMKDTFNSSMSSKVQEEMREEGRSSWKQYKNKKYQLYSFDQNGDTQKLFTPDDLSNEMLYPNPYELDSEVYQNKHAKEADFVLNKPKKRPRKVPLPSNFKMIKDKDLETQRIRGGGLIEPLATEDDLALREGTKLFIENGTLEGSKLLDICSLDPVPLEAINFALENKIDNFEREEYVRFKKANKSDLTEFSDSFFILSISSKLESKAAQLNGWDKPLEINHIETTGKVKEKAQLPTENNDENVNREKTADNISRNYKEVITNKSILSETDGELKLQSSFQNLVEQKSFISVKDTISALSNAVDEYLVELNDLDRPISHEHQCREQFTSLHPVTCANKDVRAPEQNCVSDCGDVRSRSQILQNTLDLKSTVPRTHKRNTKHSKNVKYIKLTDHTWTSFDSDDRMGNSAGCETDHTAESNTSTSHQDFELCSSVTDKVAAEEGIDSGNQLSMKRSQENACKDNHSHVPYEPLLESKSSIGLSSSDSPSQLGEDDNFPSTGATRKETKKRRCSQFEQNDGDERSAASAGERSSSSASLSPSSDSTSSSVSSSSSSSESTSSSSKDSSDVED